jgi:anti-sigma B factor antagonist
MEVSVRTRQIDSTTYRIALAGEFDLHASPEFSHDLHTCIEHGAREVIVDLSAASFIDSTFLGILLGGVRRLHERGGKITVQCPDSLLGAFEVTGLDRVLTIDHAPVAVAEPAA